MRTYSLPFVVVIGPCPCHECGVLVALLRDALGIYWAVGRQRHVCRERLLAA